MGRPERLITSTTSFGSPGGQKKQTGVYLLRRKCLERASASRGSMKPVSATVVRSIAFTSGGKAAVNTPFTGSSPMRVRRSTPQTGAFDCGRSACARRSPAPWPWPDGAAGAARALTLPAAEAAEAHETARRRARAGRVTVTGACLRCGRRPAGRRGPSRRRR